MKLYTIIINEETKEVLIINQEEAKSLGYEEMDVEFAYNNKAYVLGYAPEKPLELLKEEKIAELRKQRDIYKKKTYLKEGYTMWDFEPYSCYNYNNLVRLKYGWTQEDLDLFDAITSHIVSFYDSKKEAINNATTKEELDQIDVVFTDNN
ncbi:hypothetical protein J5751_04900 [bacterium]|nr:hypothetical protein [bacterium]